MSAHRIKSLPRRLGSFLLSILALLLGGAGLFYLGTHWHEYPWWKLPVAVLVAGHTLPFLAALLDEDGPRGGDLTSQHDGIGAMAIMFFSWVVAIALVVGHYV